MPLSRKQKIALGATAVATVAGVIAAAYSKPKSISSQGGQGNMLLQMNTINAPVVGPHGESVVVTSLTNYTSAPYILSINFSATKLQPSTDYFVDIGMGIYNFLGTEESWQGQSFTSDSNGNITGHLNITFIVTMMPHELRVRVNNAPYPFVCSTLFTATNTPGTSLNIEQISWDASTGRIYNLTWSVSGFTKSAGRDAVYTVDEFENGAMHINTDGTGKQTATYFHAKQGVHWIVVHGWGGELISAPFMLA